LYRIRPSRVASQSVHGPALLRDLENRKIKDKRVTPIAIASWHSPDTPPSKRSKAPYEKKKKENRFKQKRGASKQTILSQDEEIALADPPPRLSKKPSQTRPNASPCS